LVSVIGSVIRSAERRKRAMTVLATAQTILSAEYAIPDSKIES
jgi:hypothetical protein